MLYNEVRGDVRIPVSHKYHSCFYHSKPSSVFLSSIPSMNAFNHGNRVGFMLGVVQFIYLSCANSLHRLFCLSKLFSLTGGPVAADATADSTAVGSAVAPNFNLYFKFSSSSASCRDCWMQMLG